MVPKTNLDAYSAVFEIEHVLKDILKNYHVRYKPTLFDLIDYIHQSKAFHFDSQLMIQLFRTVEIRNKVCHMECITDFEYNTLFECKTALFKYVQSV